MTPLSFGCALSTSNAEPSIGQFELKTLDSSPGSIELQSQNAWSWGQPARRVANDDENRLVFDENEITRQRHALEIEIGFTSRLKMRVGVEFENERLDDPGTLEQANSFDGLELTELGLEVIGVLVQRPADGAGVGVVAEFERPVDDDEPDRLNLGAIIEYQSGRWFLAAVPLAVRTLGGRTNDGEQIDNKWDFAYAAQVMYSMSDAWSLALEAYGTVERLEDSGHPSQAAQLFDDFDQHRAGPVLYYAHDFRSSDLAIGIGLLAGLSDQTPDQTLKLSIELSF